MYYEANSLPLVLEGPDTEWRVQKGMAGMAVAFAKLPKGTDFTPLLKGLKGDMCQCTHWGYLIEGKLHMKYQDGTEEVIPAGSVFYLQEGHTAWAEEDTKFIDFSHEGEFAHVVKHITGKDI